MHGSDTRHKGSAAQVDRSARNVRRAVLVAGIPALIVFVLLVVVLTLMASAAFALSPSVVVGIVVWVICWRGAAGRVLRSINAHPLYEDDQPRIANMVDHLCASMGLPVPALYIVDDAPPNALALGRSPKAGVLVLTSGLLHGFEPVQLEGVLAHELTHIKQRDTALSTMAAAVALPVAGLLGGGGALVHQIAGRGREFHVDQEAVGVTRYPPGLRQALAAMAEEVGQHPDGLLPMSSGGRVTRWMWTVALGAPLDGDSLVGELDAPAVRIAALSEY